MLSENIKTLRKQKGYSQEQLADKLNVVRQTVSKWEKGYSVPDADMLEELSDIFEVPVGELLGKEFLTEKEATDIGELVKQLTILNNYFSEKIRRRKKFQMILKRSFDTVCIIAILFCIYLGTGFFLSKGQEIFRDETSITLTCTLENKNQYVKMGVSKDNNKICSISWSNDLPKNVKDILESTELFDKTPEEAIKEIEAGFAEKDVICEIKYEDLNSINKIIGLIKTGTNL